MDRLLVSVVTLGALSLEPSPSETESRTPPPARIELSWDAPAECPSAADIETRYRNLLEQAPSGHGTMVANGRVWQDPQARWTVELTTVFNDASHTRRLQASRCDALGDAVAVVFAIALEPGLKMRPPNPSPPPAPSSVSIAPPPPSIEPDAPSMPAQPPADPPPAAPQPPRQQLRLPPAHLRAGVGVERGAVPGAAVMPSLSLGISWPRARAEVDAAWLSPRSTRGPTGATAAAQYVIGAARGCYLVRDRKLQVPACVGLEGGTLFGSSRGLPQDGSVRGPWVAPTVRVALARRWRRIGVYAGLELARHVIVTRLRIDDDVVFVPSAISARGLAAVEFFFSPPGP